MIALLILGITIVAFNMNVISRQPSTDKIFDEFHEMKMRSTFRDSYWNAIDGVIPLIDSHLELYHKWEKGEIKTAEYTQLTSEQVDKLNSLMGTILGMESSSGESGDWKQVVLYDVEALREFASYLELTIEYAIAIDSGATDVQLRSTEDKMDEHLDRWLDFIDLATEAEDAIIDT